MTTTDRDDALREIEEQTPVGLVYLDALMRRQRRLSLVVAGALILLLLAQPLVAMFVPAYASIRVLDIPLPWLLLGFAAYPVMVLLGFLYVREAEATDDDFADLLRR
jgi:uncharacterized membrane protein